MEKGGIGMVKSMDIADYFVKSSIKQGIEINNLKLQKLLYYFYAKNLVENEVNIFEDKFEKWQYGPVLPTVYHAYKQFGGFNIEHVPSHYKLNDNQDDFIEYKFSDDDLPSEIRASIDLFVEKFKKYSPFDLVKKTHHHDEWKKDETLINAGVKNLEYSDKATKEYFEKNTGECLWL